MRGPLRDAVNERLLDAGLADMGIERPMTEKLLEEHQSGKFDHTHRLFALLTLSAWYDWLGRTVSESNRLITV